MQALLQSLDYVVDLHAVQGSWSQSLLFHLSDTCGGVGGDVTRLDAPAAESTQGPQASVDGGRFVAFHVLHVGAILFHVYGGNSFQGWLTAIGLLAPAGELLQIVAVVLDGGLAAVAFVEILDEFL